MNRPLLVILAAVTLDSIGIGLIFPILPKLLEQVTHVDNIAPYVGLTHERAFGRTASLQRDEGEGVGDTRIVVGLRTWF